jgi:hypothetical protein
VHRPAWQHRSMLASSSRGLRSKACR